MIVDITTGSVKQTKDLAKKIAKELQGGEILALNGDLGSGKTSFVQGLGEGLGIRRPITSPTYVIIKPYKAAVLTLYHMDFYRLKDLNDVKDIGFEEILGEKKGVLAIEWPKIAESLLPEDRLLKMSFSLKSENVRQIIFEWKNKRFDFIKKISGL